jgi:metal-responsive CopG/Arc/MetJ family transcriptional regulator
MSRTPPEKTTTKSVLVKMPRPLVEIMDQHVQNLDLDRSKFIRTAIREKIQRHSEKQAA